jgi:hypothetical protein
MIKEEECILRGADNKEVVVVVDMDIDNIAHIRKIEANNQVADISIMIQQIAE